MARNPDVDDVVSRVSIAPLDDGSGFEINDRIERRRCEVTTDTPPTLRRTDPDSFRYPVDTAAEFSASEFTFQVVSSMYVHGEGELVQIGHFEERSFDAGSYEIELTSPMKIYLRIEAPFSVRFSVGEATIAVDGTTPVQVGARSFHERPAATVTTTTDPHDLMAAVSTFGSALKTTTSERSYPTLRGHPPALSVGEQLSIPRGLRTPDTGVTIEVPPTMESVFVVSTLSHYLAADVRPGPRPQLVTDEGFSYDLDGAFGFEETVERTLKQCFLLDCVVRTAGPRPVPLYERKALNSAVDLDFDALYEMSLQQQLAEYLRVPFERLAEHVPQWKLVSHVTSRPESIDVLPYLVNDLSIVRTAERVTDGATADDRRSESNPSEAFVEPSGTDSLEQAWVGPGAPFGASKAMTEAYRNRFAREPTDGDIRLVVVCNDEQMLEEHHVAEEVYGSREDLPFELSFYEGLTTDRLQLVLESDTDFFHYIGHVEDGGFDCSDGLLDAATLETVGVDVFFLNACRSYRQGTELIRRGAVGGVVTIDDIINTGAVRIGKTLARLLNIGFPLRSALNIARDRSIIGSQYLVIGDGNADIAQSETTVTTAADITTLDGGENDYSVDVLAYLTGTIGLGVQFQPAIADNEDVFLCPGVTGTFRVSRAELEEFLSLETIPVFLDGEFSWSDTVSLDGE